MQKDWHTERLVYRKTGIQAVRHADKQTRKPAEMPTNDSTQADLTDKPRRQTAQTKSDRET